MKTKPMRIILGCDPLLMPLTGIGRYTNQLGKGLLDSKDVQSVLLFAHGRFFDTTLLESDASSKTNINGFESDKESRVNPTVFSTLRTILAKSALVVKLYQKLSPHLMRYSLRTYKDAVFHSPNFSLPPFDGKKVVTIHDLSTILYPQFHPPARVSFVNDAIKNAVIHSDHIISDSEFIRQEIIEHFAVEPERVTSIPLAADASFCVRNEQQCQPVLDAYQLNYKGYFLFVSTIEPRKNISNLLEAYKGYRQECPDGMPLVMIGNEGWNSGEIHRTITEFTNKGWVKYLGYVNQAHLPLFYAAARTLLFPSLYEGFGLPVLEAMKSGTAVLTSQNSSMSEITQDNALLIEPFDIDSMKRQIIELSMNDELVMDLQNKGLERSKVFGWEKTLSRTIEVYKTL